MVAPETIILAKFAIRSVSKCCLATIESGIRINELALNIASAAEIYRFSAFKHALASAISSTPHHYHSSTQSYSLRCCQGPLSPFTYRNLNAAGSAISHSSPWMLSLTFTSSAHGFPGRMAYAVAWPSISPSILCFNPKSPQKISTTANTLGSSCYHNGYDTANVRKKCKNGS